MANRNKPPISQWIVDERKRLGWKPADISRRLKDLGYEAEESTVQVWEAGRSPKTETIEGLEQLFGSSAPREQAEQSANTAVLVAIERQTQMLERQWEATTALVGHLASLIDEMRAARAEAAGRDTALVEILARLEVAAEPSSTPVEAAQPPELQPQSK